MSQLVGNYKSVPISMQDIDVFQSLSPELKKASGDCGPFTIKKVWSQVVSGVNRFYHVLSESGKKYSARIYYPLPSAGEMPSLTLFMKGWVSPNGRKLTFNSDDELTLNAARKLTKLGAFKEHAPTSSDRDLVRKFTPEILHALGEHMLCAKQNIQITAAWEQVVAGRNEFYHLKVNGKMRCSVNIFVPLGEEQSEMTYFAKGLVNPTTVPEIDPTKDVLSLIVIGGFTEKNIEHSDIVQNQLHTPDYQKDSGQLNASFATDRVWKQVVNGQNLYYNLTSSSNTPYSSIVYAPIQGDSVVTFFVRGHHNPTTLKAPEYQTELKNRLSLGGYGKLQLSSEDDQRIKKLTDKLVELNNEDKSYTVESAWIKTSPTESSHYYILKGQDSGNHYSTNIKSSFGRAEEQITHFLKEIVLPSYHTDDTTSKEQSTILIGDSEAQGIEEVQNKQKQSITVSNVIYGEYKEVIPVPQVDQKVVDQLINKIIGKKDKHTIIREWEKIVSGLIKYCWIQGSKGDKYTTAILFPVNGVPHVLSFSSEFIDPNMLGNSTSLELYSKIGRFEVITPSSRDFSLVAANTPRLVELSGEKAETTFNIFLAGQQSVIGGMNKFYQLISSTNKNYSVEIFVNLDEKSKIIRFYKNHIEPVNIENPNLVTIQKKQYVKLLIGGYSDKVVTLGDYQLIKKHKEDICKLANTQSTNFYINQAWVQVVNGQNRYYWVTSQNDVAYSVVINIPPLGVDEQSKVISLVPNHVYPNERKQPTSDKSGAYEPRPVNKHDIMLVAKHTHEMISVGQPFIIKSVESQIVNGTNNRYLLESLTSRYRSVAVIYEPLTGPSILISYQRLYMHGLSDSQKNREEPNTGEYVPYPVTEDDRKLLSQHKYELIVLTLGDQGPFDIVKSEKQVVNGVNNKYILRSQSTNDTYEVIIYQRPNSSTSVIVFFVRLLQENLIDGQQNKTKSQIGKYVPHDIKDHDKDLVKTHTPDMIKQYPLDQGQYIILKAWVQTVNGLNNKYLLQSASTRSKYHAVIYETFDGSTSFLQSFIQLLEQNLSDGASIEPGEYKQHEINNHDKELVKKHKLEMVVLSPGDQGQYQILTAQKQVVNGFNNRYLLRSASTGSKYIAIIYQQPNSPHSILTYFVRLWQENLADGEQNKASNQFGQYVDHEVNDHDRSLVNKHYMEMVARSTDMGPYKILRASSQTVNGVNNKYYLHSSTFRSNYVAIIYEPFDQTNKQSTLVTFRRLLLGSTHNGQQLNKSNPEYEESYDKPSLQLIDMQEEGSYEQKTVTPLDRAFIASQILILEKQAKQPGAVFTVDKAWERQTFGATYQFYWISDQKKNEFSAQYIVQINRSTTVKLNAFYFGHVDPNKLGKSESTIQSNSITPEDNPVDKAIVISKTPEMNAIVARPFNIYKILSSTWTPGTLDPSDKGKIPVIFTYNLANQTQKKYVSVIKGKIDLKSFDLRVQSMVEEKNLKPVENSIKELVLGGATWRSTHPADYKTIEQCKTEIDQFTQKQNDSYTILSTWYQPTSNISNCYWLTDKSGSVYSVIIIMDRTMQSKPIVYSIKYGLTKPYSPEVLFDGQLSVSGKYGGYQLQEVSGKTVELIDIIKRELMGRKDVQFNVLCEWKQMVNGMNNFFWVECDSQFYSINIFTSPEKFHLPQITYLAKMIVSPVDGTEHLLGSTILFRDYGAYRFHVVKGDDQKSVNDMTSDLKSITDAEKFKVLAAWSQVVSGINNFYWIQGNNMKLYSVNFYTPFGMDNANTKTTYFSEGLRNPTAGTDQIVLSSSLLGGYHIHELKHKDLELVDFVTPEIQKQNGEQCSFYVPVAGWRQILSHGTNEYYWVKSSTLKQYSVNVICQYGQNPVVNECQNGFVYPNKQHILTGQYKSKYGGETWQPLTILDIEFLRKHNKEINEKSGEKESIFVPMSLWVQAVNPPQRTYWLTTLSGKAYTTIFSGDEITSCNHGLILPGVPPHYSASMNLKQLYYPVMHTQCDNVLIKSFEKDLQQASGEQGDVTFKIDMMWSQMEMTFELNKFYWLTSSSGKKYSANISFIAPLMRYSDMTKFTEHWVNPNLI